MISSKATMSPAAARSMRRASDFGIWVGTCSGNRFSEATANSWASIVASGLIYLSPISTCVVRKTLREILDHRTWIEPTTLEISCGYNFRKGEKFRFYLAGVVSGDIRRSMSGMYQLPDIACSFSTLTKYE